MYTVYIFKLEKLKLHIIKFLFGTSILMGASLILRSRKILLREAALYPMLSRTQELGAIGFFVNAILRGHPPARHASKNMHPFPADLIFFYFSLKWGISVNSRKKLDFLLLRNKLLKITLQRDNAQAILPSYPPLPTDLIYIYYFRRIRGILRRIGLR